MLGRSSSATAAPGLPPRAHARVLPPRRRARRRLHRARPRQHQGRRARRPPRAGDRRHHQRRRPPRVRLPQEDQGDRRHHVHRLVHRGLHAARSSRRCARRSASRPSARTTRLYDGKFEIPTFQEVLDLRAGCRASCTAQIGVYPETKHPTYFRSIGLPLEPKLVSTLNRNGLNRKGAPVFVQSFEIGNLQALNHVLKVPLVQLLDEPDLHPAGDPSQPSYGEMATPAGPAQDRDLRRRRRAVEELHHPARPPDDCTGKPTSFVKDAHRAGLVVHPYTFRRENTFVAARAAVVGGSRRDRRPRLGDPPVHSGSGWTASSPTTRTTASGPAPSIAVDAAGRAPRRLPAPVRAPGGQPAGERMAAVIDLGSNSWRLVVYAYVPGASWRRVGSCRSRCGSRKASAAPARSSPSAMARGLETLEMFGRYCAPAACPTRPSTRWRPARSATPTTAPTCSRWRTSAPASRSRCCRPRRRRG